MTPQDTDFAGFYEQRSLEYDMRKVESRAPADPVPAREPAYHLIKRWRNVIFVRPSRSGLRRLPSVLLSKLIADNANQTRTLSEEVEHQARSLLLRLESERRSGRLIRETNPRCDADVLTDRWPETHADQDLAISDLRDFVKKIHRLRTADLTLPEMSSILEDLFGTRPARQAVREYLNRAPAVGRSLSLPTPLWPGRCHATTSLATEVPFLSVAEQDARVREQFPAFRLLLDAGFIGWWRGSLAPIRKVYEVEVIYCPFKFYFDDFELRNPWISVRVLSPRIGLDPRGSGEPPTHIYRDDDGDGFRLCLYDPRKDEWSPERLIADTVLPWASEWLFYYEGWLVTGEWTGGGTHPTLRESECPTSSPSYRDQRGRFPHDVSSRVGLLAGTSASLQLMAAASEGYSLPEFWRISKRRWAAGARSPISLT
jgi:hypothetical protein